MDCRECGEESNFKCRVDKLFFCRAHSKEHEELGREHRCETLNRTFEITESTQLKINLTRLITELRSTQLSISSECNDLIQRVEDLRSKAFTKIASQIFHFQNLIQQQRYTDTDRVYIQGILNQTLQIERPESITRILSSILLPNRNSPMPQQRSPIKFNDLDLELKKKVTTIKFVGWNPSEISQNLIEDIKMSKSDKLILFCKHYSGKLKQKTGKVLDKKLVFNKKTVRVM